MPTIEQKGGLFQVLLLSSGNVLGMVISALALILYSRYMGPTEFGIFSVAFAFMQIVIRVADFGTNMAAERAIARLYDQSAERSDALMRTTLWLKAASFVVVASATWLLTPWIAHSLLHLDNIPLIRSAIVLALGTIIFEYATLVFQSTHRFALVARIMIAQGLGKLLFSLLLMWQGALTSTLGLVIYGLMPGIGALLGFSRATLSSLTLPKRWRQDLTGILKVAKWTSVAALALTIADNLDILMVQSLMSSYDTGIWSGAVRIAAFANLIGWSLGSVLNVRVARYHKATHLNEYLSKAWKLSLLVFGVLLLAIPLSSLAVELTIGASYGVATAPLQILLVSIALAAATVPFSALFYVFDNPQYYAASGLIQTVLLVAGDYYLIPLYGLDGSAWVRVGVRLILLIFTLLYARRAYLTHFAKRNLAASSV